MNDTRHAGPAARMYAAMPSEARDAMLRAIAEYEPTAMAAIIASPAHLLGVLLEVSWRALGAAAPLIAAAERERIAEIADERGATVIEPGGPFGAGVIRPFADLIRENRP